MRHIAIILLFFLHLLDGFEIIRKDPNCNDLYDHYCKEMSPEKCYLGYNAHLCCDTCTAYQLEYRDLDTDVVCPYGDRDWRCEKMKTSDCYNLSDRYRCCGTCAGVKTSIPDCLYGDHDSHACANVKPYHCYDAQVRDTCCHSCAKYHTRREDCPYGDRRTLIEESDKLYTCHAYVGHLGYSRCFPFEKNAEFRRTCCGSCHSVNKRKYWQVLFG